MVFSFGNYKYLKLKNWHVLSQSISFFFKTVNSLIYLFENNYINYFL